jgi:hypothetical protein
MLRRNLILSIFILNFFDSLQILIEILDNLDKFHLNNLVRANKRLQALSQYLLEHKKKIRFCADHLRVLVLSLPSSFGKYNQKTILLV